MFRKLIALLLIWISLLAVFSPVSLHAQGTPGKSSVLMTLNVCHVSAGLFADASDLPAVHEGPVSLNPWSFTGTLEVLSVSLYQMLVAFQDERPPKA